MQTSTGSGVVAAALLAVLGGTAVGADELQPRRELSSHAVLERPAVPHRLVVKFRDGMKVRGAAGGDLQSLAGADLERVKALALRHGATFGPHIKLPAARLEAMEQRAAAASGIAQPDLQGIMEIVAPEAALLDLARALADEAAVEYVSFEELMPPPPCADASPATPTYVSMQGYRGPDPGLNMLAARLLGNARGAGITIADCEYGYNASHEDLCGIVMEPGQTIHPNVISNAWDEHGTAVFGEMIGVDNAYGCEGLVPDANAKFFTEWSVEEGLRRNTAIASGIASVSAGDIVVLEMQAFGAGGGYGPAEVNQTVWTLCKNGTDAGVIVVGAAGNGNQDLDSAPYATYMGWGDSGAIIVGAGSADTSHNKLSFSTYGSRVNVQGWGGSVFTTGYGSFAALGGDKNQRYTSTFNGTSSATPLVASACAALQGLAVEALGAPLPPDALRDLLIDTGVSQGSGGHIGPLPDVEAAALAMVPCPSDCESGGNGQVNVGDLLKVLAEWGTPGPHECDVKPLLSGDGTVDIDDLLGVLEDWGACTP